MATLIRNLVILCALFSSVKGQTKVTAIRLAGVGATTRKGRVEIQIGGTWGTICDNGFSTKAALNSAVICRMLGFQANPAQQNTNTYGSGSGAILMSQVACLGTEQNIDDCQFVPSSSVGASCTHDKDVAVECFGKPLPATTTTTTTTPAPPTPPPTVCSTPSTDVRLMDGNTKAEGRVEILRNGVWGTICDDTWGYNEAQVICRMLCYPVANARAHLGQHYKNGTGQIWQDGLRCQGSESTITACTLQPWGQTDCTHAEDAGVSCVRDTPTPPKVPTPQVRCEQEEVGAYFSRAENPALTERELRAGLSTDFGCGFTTGTTSTEIFIKIPFVKCNTKRSNNETSIIYSNSVIYNVSDASANQVITRTNLYEIPVSCVVRRHSNKDKDFEPAPRTAPPQEGASGFDVQMHVYKSDKMQDPVTTYPAPVKLGEYLFVGVIMYTSDPTLKVVVTNCVATAQVERNSTPSYTFIENKCRLDKSVTFYPYNDTFFAYSFQTFKFFGDAYKQVYIHCDAIVCEQKEKTDQCDRTCKNAKVKRQARSISDVEKTPYYMDDGPFLFFDDSSPEDATSKKIPVVSSEAVHMRSAIIGVFITLIVGFYFIRE